MDRPAILLLISAILIIFLLQPTSASSTSGGYDSSGSCYPRPSRRGRAQLLAAIPCDLTVQAYCNLPGNAYPWNAVRRFVHENQGLMKRMYGDTRHISVLKNEFEKNEIDVDDIQIAAARYSQNPGSKREERKSKYTGHAGRLNDVLVEPHFRPTTTPSSTTTTATAGGAAPENVTESSAEEKSVTNQSEPSYIEEIENLKNKYEILLEDAEIDTKPRDESLETNSIFENTTEGHQPVSLNQEKWTGNRSSSEEQQQISSTLKIVKVEGTLDTTTTRTRNNSNQGDGQSSSAAGSSNSEPIEDLGDMIIVENESGGGSYREPSSASQIKLRPTTEKTGTTTKNYSPLDRVDDFSAESSEIYTETKSSGGQTFGEEKHKTTLVKTVAQKQESSSSPQQPQTMMEGHLYQDSVQKNNPSPPVVMSGRGVNACPVKEEVVAPFWANNTRGEVLALLNLYPFEQYVHWEKCTHEHKQMYCREGCRCEQQYRLHRLLAYDPHNECRGIFSDWFRFPSCCICKCYDIPNEFRVTSRSPRSPRETPVEPKAAPSSGVFSAVEEAEHNLNQAIYSHATEDWYHRSKRDTGAEEIDGDIEIDDAELEEFDDEWL